MTTTALLLAVTGAERVTVRRFVDSKDQYDPEGNYAEITDRDGTNGRVVPRSLLRDFREED